LHCSALIFFETRQMGGSADAPAAPGAADTHTAAAAFAIPEASELPRLESGALPALLDRLAAAPPPTRDEDPTAAFALLGELRAAIRAHFPAILATAGGVETAGT
jgi:hypothetical protein